MTDRALTTSAVNRSGRRLKHYFQGEYVTREQIASDIEVLLAFRALHQAPLGAATMGLRSMVKTAGCAVEVSQRLKRVPTIIDKLDREPSLPLAAMQDIGGCRAVVATISDLRRVESRLRKNRPPVRVSDYVTDPRASGYRGVHIVVDYHGRKIEVQLRTTVMHEWAITVERLSGRLGANLKGDGRHVVQQLLATISHAMALEEAGMMVDGALLDLMAAQRTAAAPYLSGGRP